MPYKVYNDDGISVMVSNEQLKEALKEDGATLPVEIIQVMSMTRDARFIPRFKEALNHGKRIARIHAMFGILSIGDSKYSSILQEKIKSISNKDISQGELNLLNAVIIRLEKGSKGIIETFIDNSISSAIKLDLPYIYSSAIHLDIQDVEFIIMALKVFIEKGESWVYEIKSDDYEDVIIKCLEALVKAAEEGELLNELPPEINKNLSKIGSLILKMKIDPYAKECIATFAKGLPSKVAYLMLEPIMDGSARGDARKELNKTLKVLRQKEQNEVKKDVHGA